jgi:hypothetical protein
VDRHLPPETLEQLFASGEELWRRHKERRSGAFHGFVPADYPGAYEILRELRSRATSFVELGSGAGVITVLADLLGYDAYGLEIEPWLVESARELAAEFDSDAAFVEGSFLPTGFRGEVELVDPEFLVTYDGAASAWDELGLDPADFDLVYAFPWPGEEELFRELLRVHGRRGGLFLTYGAAEGYLVHELE